MLLLFLFLFFSFAARVVAPEDDCRYDAVSRFKLLLDRLDNLRDVQQTIASNVAPVLPSGLLAALLLTGWCALCARRIAASWKVFSRWVESIGSAYPSWSSALLRCVVLVNLLLKPFRNEVEQDRVLAAAKAEAAIALQEVQRDLSDVEEKLAAATQRAARAEQAAEIAELGQQEAETSLVQITANCAAERVLLATLKQQVTRMEQATSEGLRKKHRVEKKNYVRITSAATYQTSTPGWGLPWPGRASV
ncbi:uncharacterized protein EKO05_0010853 [Ascochyta rabiei]|nr:uncharacterized protein EKO05_0010853 [Ascochyta rabiei]UPX20625.1 hypothetical protein EKO05_0010853 [Ascochyta rabiei]